MIERTTLGFIPGGFLKVKMQFDPAAPIQVVFTFETNSGDIEWLFARQLLSDGLEDHAGIGDVSVSPATDGNVTLSLSSDSGEQDVKLSYLDVRQFLADTLTAVPLEREAELAALAVDTWFKELS